MGELTVSFYRHCTEILALLPFTLPDEPLYLIYAINRVIQVRAGVLEAKLKALSLHLSQRVAPRENGRVRDESTAQPIPDEMTSMDVGGTIHQEPASQNHMLSMDLNGTVQPEPADQFVSGQGDTPLTGSGNSSDISKDDEQMIQVDLKRLVISHLCP